MSIRAVQGAYYLAKEKAGITKQCGIHTLRHSFATHCLETGMGIFQVQKFLGHKCLKTTLQYVHLQEENIIAQSPLDIYVQEYKKAQNNNK
jgi:site-specific recombinase XerD